MAKLTEFHTKGAEHSVKMSTADLVAGAGCGQEASAASARLRVAISLYIVTLGILGFQFVNNVREVDTFKTVHWIWDYELGFVKRALPGAIAEWLLG